MRSRSSRRCGVARLLLAALLLPLSFVLVLGAASPAAAHATLISTDPAEGAVLETTPAEVTFTFNESVIGVPAGIQVFDATGAEVASKASVRKAQLVVELQEEIEGTAVIVWRLVSADGHPIGGSLSFSVGEPSKDVVVPTATADAGTDAPLLLGVVRWIGYLGLLVTAGVAAFSVLFLPAGRANDAARRRLRGAARGAAVVGVIAFWLAVPLVALYQLGLPASALGQGSTWSALATPEWVVPAAVLAGLALAVGALPTSAPDRLRTGCVLAGCVVALAAPSLTGHTRATSPQALVITVDVLHLVAGALWLGGLVAIGLVLADLAARDDSGGLVVARFSTWASAVLAALVVTGTVMAWRIAGSWSALLDTGYGTFLLVKILIVLVAITIAAWNRFSLLPRLRAVTKRKERRDSASLLVRTTVAEAGVLVAVLLVTGFLVDRSPEPDVAVTSPSGQGAASARQSVWLGGIIADVSLAPLAVGPATVTITMTDPDGAPKEGYAAPRISLSTTDVDLGDIELANQGPGIYTGEVVLPTNGTWEAQVSLRTTEFDNPVKTVRFEVP
jgi:copper transport protein